MKDIAAAVRQKLRNLARKRQEDFDYVLRQYVMQRLLYRLSCSAYVDQFLLVTTQPTRAKHLTFGSAKESTKIGRVKAILCY